MIKNLISLVPLNTLKMEILNKKEIILNQKNKVYGNFIIRKVFLYHNVTWIPQKEKQLFIVKMAQLNIYINLMTQNKIGLKKKYYTKMEKFNKKL